MAGGLVMADTEEQARSMIGPIPNLELFPKREGILWPGPQEVLVDLHHGPFDKTQEGFTEAIHVHRRVYDGVRSCMRLVHDLPGSRGGGGRRR